MGIIMLSMCRLLNKFLLRTDVIVKEEVCERDGGVSHHRIESIRQVSAQACRWSALTAQILNLLLRLM